MQGAQTRYRTDFPRDTRVSTSLIFDNTSRLCSGFRALEGVDEGFLVLDFESLDHSAGGWVDIQKVGVGEGRDLWDVVVSSLSFLLLELDGDASNGTGTDSLHQMSDESGDLVSESLGGDDGDLLDDSLVGVEVQVEHHVVLLYDSAGSLLDSLCTNTAHGESYF